MQFTPNDLAMQYVKHVWFSLFTVLVFLVNGHGQVSGPGKKTMNIIFILSDDHRYDAMGFINKITWLKTPGMDRMAREGVHIKNAFVSTSLCSPSRASILTGQYAHTHTVVDNSAALPPNLTFFPQYLQQAGYQTAFMGKWHMGNEDASPQPGFNYWSKLSRPGRVLQSHV